MFLLDKAGKRKKGESLKQRMKGPYIIGEVTKSSNVKLTTLDGKPISDRSHKMTTIKKYNERMFIHIYIYNSCFT